MLKADPEKKSSDAAAEPSPAARQKEDETAGSAALTPGQKLADEAEAFCADLERFFRRAFGEVPKATELGEIRAQQATVRDLVRRGCQLGGESGQRAATAETERDKYKDAAARARSDFLNYQTRSARDLERAEELALRGYVSELLPILDSLDLAERDAQAEGTASADPQRVREALTMIGASLRQVLAVRGLERIGAAGRTFDPNLHEAVAKRPADPSRDEKPGTVLEELRPGYLWKGLLLRPAQVLVAEAEKPAQPVNES